jgi:hypothetical protein
MTPLERVPGQSTQMREGDTGGLDACPIMAVKVFSPTLGEAVWVVTDEVPRDQWPRDALVYTHQEVKILSHVGPDTLKWVHPVKELFGACVIDGKVPKQKGDEANR